MSQCLWEIEKGGVISQKPYNLLGFAQSLRRHQSGLSPNLFLNLLWGGQGSGWKARNVVKKLTSFEKRHSAIIITPKFPEVVSLYPQCSNYNSEVSQISNTTTYSIVICSRLTLSDSSRTNSIFNQWIQSLLCHLLCYSLFKSYWRL